MCKIVAFSNTSKLDRKAPNKIGTIINKIERDGYGYAVTGLNGTYGEKSVFSSFRSRLTAKNEVTLPITKRQHEVFGKPAPFAGAGIFHGRTSTNDAGLLNCHPMQRSQWHLIHNGVVTDNGPKYVKQTTNDSEDVLFRLIEGISSVEKHLSGYYAFAAIDPEGRLHIGRDSIATLFVAFSAEKETYIFATTEDLLKAVTKALSIKHGPIDAVADNTYAIFKGNELLSNQTISPLGYSSRESQYAGRSLGFDLGNSVIDATGEGWPDEKESKFKFPKLFSSEKTKGTVADEDSYYMYRHEIDHMDRSYQILTESGYEIDLRDFKQMGWREQESCRIFRADGSEVTMSDEDKEMLHG